MKGLGYALEAMVASVTLLIFTLGALQVSGPEQDWSEYQRDLAAQDLTYSLEASGHTSNFLSRGETGTIQTVAATVTDRDMEASGLVSGLPVNELSLGFYTLEEERFKVDITDNLGGCDNQLGELVEDSSHADEDELYRTDGMPDEYDVDLYFADVGGDGYDSLWVDNGTDCQFAAEDGPHHLDEIFYWGDEDTAALPEYTSDMFEFKDINVNDEEAVFYNASETWSLTQEMEPGPNEIRTDVTVSMADETQLNIQEHDIGVFRGTESLEIEDVIEDQIEDGSALFMLNPDEDDFDGSILQDLGFAWMDTGYRETYGDEPLEASFSSEPDSLELETLYTGMEGEEAELRPPGEIVSNTSDNLRPSRTLYANDLSYDVSEWNQELREEDFDEVQPSDVEGEPDSACYNIYNENEERPLTEAENIEFEGEGEVDILSAKLGSEENLCGEFVERGIKIDRGDGYEASDLYLNGELVEIGGREYVVESLVDLSEEGCEKHGDCANFISSVEGEDQVSLLASRTRYSEIEGGRTAVTGYPDSIGEEQEKILGSILFWLGDRETGFQGREEPEAVETTSIGDVEGEAYLPYELRLRWSE